MGHSNTFGSKKKPAPARWLAPVGVAVTTLAVGVTAGPAQAAPDFTVPIPLHPVPADIHLIGASPVGVAVQQDDVNGGSYPVRPVYTGPLGGELTRRTQMDPTVTTQQLPTMVTVAGSTLAWYENLQRAGSQPKTGHQLNLLTGQDVVNPATMARPGAFNGESWFSDEVLSFADFPGNWQRPLRRYRADGSTSILIPNVPGVVGAGLAADPTGVLRATQISDLSGDRFAIDLVTLKTGAVSRIVEGGTRFAALALTADQIVWALPASGGRYTIYQKPRAGGAVTTFTETDEHADISSLVAGAGGIAYFIQDPSATRASVAIVKGAMARYQDLPYDASGLAPVGDTFLTVSNGYVGPDRTPSSYAGVYRIGENAFTRVATVPAATLNPLQLSLSAGRLRYSDKSEADQPGRPVFERSVSDDRRAKFSSETELTRTSGGMAFSAARGVVGIPGQSGLWQLLDRGQETERVEALGTPNISGLYTLIGGKVFRPDGERTYTEPVPAGTTSGADDLFGSAVTYVRTAADGTSTIWMDSADHSAPTTVATTTDAGCAGLRPKVSLWGETVAWSSSCGDKLFVKNLRTGSTREIAQTEDTLGSFMLSEGTLSWSDLVYGRTRTLDLTNGSSTPVLLDAGSQLFSVDGHQVARLVGTSLADPAPRAELSPLPFQPKYLPRLIASYSPLGFSPDGDGRGDTWKPQFDLTKPMRSVTLKITNAAGTKTLTQIDGTAPDGSVRDLSWNGLSSKGIAQPTGLYRWTLTGRSADGDGTLINSDGTATVGGTIELDR